jgi:hypothetical protein
MKECELPWDKFQMASFCHDGHELLSFIITENFLEELYHFYICN